VTYKYQNLKVFVDSFVHIYLSIIMCDETEYGAYYSYTASG